jgi:hypothetical protein
MTGLLRDPEGEKLLKSLSILKKKYETFFISKPFKRAWDL